MNKGKPRAIPNRMLPLNDTDFRWLRYGLGIVLPLALTAGGIYSILTLHAYAISGYRGMRLIPVEGRQAIFMGVAYIGIAVMFFPIATRNITKKWAFTINGCSLRARS